MDPMHTATTTLCTRKQGRLTGPTCHTTRGTHLVTMMIADGTFRPGFEEAMDFMYVVTASPRASKPGQNVPSSIIMHGELPLGVAGWSREPALHLLRHPPRHMDSGALAPTRGADERGPKRRQELASE